MDSIHDLFTNIYFLATLTSWFVAQSIKVMANYIRHKRLDFRWFLSTGGMPSSHTSSSVTLTVLVGLRDGTDSAFFTLLILFSIIIMSDAAGVRRAAGKQAGVLNQMLDDLSHNKKIGTERLRELLGHSPIEVFAGIALGVGVALLFV